MRSTESISNVIRAGRKLKNLTQIDLASEMRITQATVSKYESGALVPGIDEWFLFCELVGADAHETYMNGLIDGPSCESLKASKFSMNKKHEENLFLYVREILPILNFIENNGLEKKFENFLKEVKFDRDYLYIVSNKLSLDFFNYLDSWLSKEIDSKYLKKMKKHFLEPANHGQLSGVFRKSLDDQTVLKSYIKNSKCYEAVFNYKIDKNMKSFKLDLQKNVMKKLDSLKNKTLKPYIDYKLNNLSILSKEIGQKLDFKLSDEFIEVRVG